MMRIRRAFMAAALAAFGFNFLGAAPALAKDLLPPFVPMPKAFTELVVKEARDGLPKAKLEDGRPVGQETPAELAQPLLPLEEAAMYVNLGAASAFAQHCKLTEWKDSVLVPMKAYQSEVLGRKGKLVTYILELHRLSEKSVKQDFIGSPPCAADEKKSITAYAAEARQYFTTP